MSELSINSKKYRFDKFIFKMILIRCFCQLLFTYRLFPNTVLNVISAFILVIVVLQLQKSKASSLFPKGLFLYWILFGYAAFSIYLNGFSLKGFSDLFSYFFYYIIACYYATRLDQLSFAFFKQQFGQFLKIFFFVLCIQVPLAYAGLGDKSTTGSVFGHANSANLFLSFLILLNIEKLKLHIIGLLFILMIVLGGRTSLIASIIIVIAVFAVDRVKAKSIKNLIVAASAYCLYVIYAALIALADKTDWNDKVKIGGSSGFGDMSLDSLKWRLQNWSYYLKDLNSRDVILFGKGIGSYINVSPHYYDQFFEVHNDFLKIAYDLGVVGLCLFLIADISLGVFFAKKSKNKGYLIALVYLLRYSFMFFDNLVTNFLGTVVFVGFLYYVAAKSKEVKIVKPKVDVYPFPIQAKKTFNITG
ncbi:O-antigen ligase family protein [Mucilaginibacter sp. X5P1]|uniref:O-antigen ligase family protein n=1 Tax=Mucilaginibacter sp. X5P1 TaxID=2723088 RepID=UPI001611F064|nr:O-antigen ligase family protein [Mucilaginibacter sp. X5P1]MBB6141206.1 hypothetical protein [Mucilaginibacter sp. X5P1]